MTDLYEEWWSQRVAMDEAILRGGDVLITGLGLGMVAETILRSQPDSTTSVTVVEAASEVIDLVGPHLEATHPSRLTIVHADAFAWTPPEDVRFSVVWHDIWPNPFDPRSVTESRQLMARYERCADWQGSWALDYRALAGLVD
jgi:spermidine synthase